MRDTLSLGPTPSDESCAQVGASDYHLKARAECQAYIALLRRAFGPEPDGASLKVTRNAHDFGEYLDVVVAYDSDDVATATYAFRLESDGPTKWDDTARKELGG